MYLKTFRVYRNKYNISTEKKFGFKINRCLYSVSSYVLTTLTTWAQYLCFDVTIKLTLSI